MCGKLSCSRLQDRSAVVPRCKKRAFFFFSPPPLFPDRESLIFAFAYCIFKAGAKSFKSSEMTKNNLIIVFIYV